MATCPEFHVSCRLDRELPTCPSIYPKVQAGLMHVALNLNYRTYHSCNSQRGRNFLPIYEFPLIIQNIYICYPFKVNIGLY